MIAQCALQTVGGAPTPETAGWWGTGVSAGIYYYNTQDPNNPQALVTHDFSGASRMDQPLPPEIWDADIVQVLANMLIEVADVEGGSGPQWGAFTLTLFWLS
jgi:hypothetical protein